MKYCKFDLPALTRFLKIVKVDKRVKDVYLDFHKNSLVGIFKILLPVETDDKKYNIELYVYREIDADTEGIETSLKIINPSKLYSVLLESTALEGCFLYSKSNIRFEKHTLPVKVIPTFHILGDLDRINVDSRIISDFKMDILINDDYRVLAVSPVKLVKEDYLQIKEIFKTKQTKEQKMETARRVRGETRKEEMLPPPVMILPDMDMEPAAPPPKNALKEDLIYTEEEDTLLEESTQEESTQEESTLKEKVSRVMEAVCSPEITKDSTGQIKITPVFDTKNPPSKAEINSANKLIEKGWVCVPAPYELLDVATVQEKLKMLAACQDGYLAMLDSCIAKIPRGVPVKDYEDVCAKLEKAKAAINNMLT
jgi:hypothetical protein